MQDCIEIGVCDTQVKHQTDRLTGEVQAKHTLLSQMRDEVVALDAICKIKDQDVGFDGLN